MTPETEQIHAAVLAREAALNAIEHDPHMAGSEAWAAHYWENGGEYPDGSHPLDHEDT